MSYKQAEEFYDAYCEAIIWQSPEDDISSLHGEPDILSPAAQTTIRNECVDFLYSGDADEPNGGDLIEAAIAMHPSYSFAQAGHDFALTRNGHGAGFWDRGLGQLGEMLSDMSRPYGDQSCYIADGGYLKLEVQ